jgi:hypothetical protein
VHGFAVFASFPFRRTANEICFLFYLGRCVVPTGDRSRPSIEVAVMKEIRMLGCHHVFVATAVLESRVPSTCSNRMAAINVLPDAQGKCFGASTGTPSVDSLLQLCFSDGQPRLAEMLAEW